MGRPIKSKFFGNKNANEVGGEGVSTVVVSNSGTLYTTSTTLTATFSAPQVKGGVTATGTATTDAAGLVSAFTLTLAGTGYTSAPTITLPATTGTTATFTVSLFATSVTQNALAFTSYISTGSSAITGGDIIKQQASRRYLVSNAQGIGQVKLVADTPAAGEMTLIATDTDGATYYVVKLTAHKATLVNISGTPLFADNSAVGWVLGTNADTSLVSLASN
jgi:hypothetical protein